jgi:hypothetical protein
MKRWTSVLIVIGLGASSVPAAALEIAQAARVGAAAGRYAGHLKDERFDSGGALADGGDATNVKLTYGGEVGYTFTFGDAYADLGLNMLKVRLQDNDNWRTDLLLTVGYYLNDKWSLFTGLRRGWQGGKLFNDDQFEELGPYLGFGFGGVQLGQSLLFNSSFAYNFDRVKDFAGAGTGFAYPGVSAKLGLNLKGTPHSLQLRVQHFWGDQSDLFADGSRRDLELRETWAVLSYVFSIGW